MSAAADIIETEFKVRDAATDDGDPYVIWAAVAAQRVKGQAPLICAAAKDETSARFEHNIWRAAYAKDGDTRAATDALWSLKFGQTVS